ncbi:hypothetical protein AVEN_93800-1 [Araneus ventricosus]|uniref:Uncharacterized protein n=1 Tax=Araneus ventricosus TaxID=182803 RepID=A0A4Y2AYV5_ARAVE|nr:hypothetical protein AVEN_93800-1 [Araneus ventricosus]
MARVHPFFKSQLHPAANGEAAKVNMKTNLSDDGRSKMGGEGVSQCLWIGLDTNAGLIYCPGGPEIWSVTDHWAARWVLAGVPVTFTNFYDKYGGEDGYVCI